jgi:hypothetical protein
MKALFSKSVIAGAVAVTAMFASVSASAATYNQFTVNPSALDTPSNNPYPNFSANKITGDYVERITFNGDGTFDVSLMWTAGQFVDRGGEGVIADSGLGARDGYGMYALYKASGVVTSAGPVTKFSFTGPGSLEVYFDKDRNTRNLGTPATGTGNFNLSNTGDDLLIAYGAALSGVGTLDTTLETCGPDGINCGSFGSTTSFNLTDYGKQFFIAPNPFYNLSFQSGQLNNFVPTGSLTIDGSLDVVFERAAEVPEPASVGLLGLGLLGLGAARRRKQAK